jgi:Helicase associated domain
MSYHNYRHHFESSDQHHDASSYAPIEDSVERYSEQHLHDDDVIHRSFQATTSKKRKAHHLPTHSDSSKHANGLSRARKILDQSVANKEAIRKGITDLQMEIEKLESQLAEKLVELEAAEKEADQIAEELVDELLEDDSLWNSMYFHLLEFYNKEGHLRIPWKKEAKEMDPIMNRLGPWLVQQRKEYREKTLDTYKVKALEKLEIEWEPYKSHWMARYDDLKAFKEREGHVRVPYQIGGRRKLKNGEFRKPVYDSLGVWVKRQRFQYKMLQQGNMAKAAEMNAEKIRLLEELGFDWALRVGPNAQSHEDWMESYEGLRQYYEEHGHSKVTEDEDKELFEWIRNQQVQLSKHESDLSEEQVSLLQDCEIEVAVARESKMEDRTQELKEFVEKHGHGVIPLTYPANPKLANWAANQRRNWKLWKNGEKSNMTAERAALFEDAGFEFDPSKERKKEAKIECHSWDDFLHEVLVVAQARRKSGNADIFKFSNRRRHLKEWCVEQRVQYFRLKWGKSSTLTNAQLKKLEDSGFDFQLDPSKFPSVGWEEHYNDLLAHYIEKGSFDMTDAPSALQAWVKEQHLERQKFMEDMPSCLTVEQIKKLDDVNFPWKDPSSSDGNTTSDVIRKSPESSTTKSWEEMFSVLLRQRIKFKSFALIPETMKELHMWMAAQRTIKDECDQYQTERSAVTEERIRKLKEVGFPWEGDRLPIPQKLRKELPSLSEMIKCANLAAAATPIPAPLPIPAGINHFGSAAVPPPAMPFINSFQMMSNAFTMGATATMASFGQQNFPSPYQQNLMQHLQSQQQNTSDLQGNNLTQAALAIMNDLKKKHAGLPIAPKKTPLLEIAPKPAHPVTIAPKPTAASDKADPNPELMETSPPRPR